MVSVKYLVLLPTIILSYMVLIEASNIRLIVESWRYYLSVLLTVLYVSSWVGITVLISIATRDSRKSLLYNLAVWSLISLPFTPQSLGYTLAYFYLVVSGGGLNIYLLEYYSRAFQNVIPSRAYLNSILSLYNTVPGSAALRCKEFTQWLLGGMPVYLPTPNIILLIYMVDLSIVLIGVASIIFEKWDF